MKEPLCLLGVLALIACGGDDGQGGSSTGNSVDPQTSVRLIDDSTFLSLSTDVDDCSAERVADPSKLSPSQEALTSILGRGSDEFIVIMKREISLASYPLPSDRMHLDNDDELSRARARELAGSQACAVRAVADEGGDYVQSFLLINAFIADLTVEQAVAISGLRDVRSVELSQAGDLP
jgi:hypothetical protein